MAKKASVKFKTVKNDFPKMRQSIKELDGKRIDIGVMGENAWLAGIHEYGCTITAESGKYLTVPVSPKSAGKKAADFNDLFCIKNKNGNKFLVRNKKINGKNELEFLFWLTESVKIPERSFLRAGFDEHHEETIKKAERLLPLVIHGEMSEDELFEEIGILLSTKIKNYARDLKDPPKSGVTAEAYPDKKNLLVNTGNMINSITYKVE